uniref:HTH_48 domain-containing protein n=1 Tax=Haemonchus contortus TaxID=6289 RepID=A0A7I4YK09_HAECO
MSDRYDHRRLLLHCYRSGHSATQARNELQAMGSTAPSLATCYRWCGRFARGETHFDKAPWSGRLRSTKIDIVLPSVQNNHSQSLTAIERATSALRSTIHDILRRCRLRAALPAVIPYTLTESERQVRFDVCRELFDRKRTVAWTSLIIAQNEKWISYRHKARSRCKGWETRQKGNDLVLLLRQLFLL